MRPLALTPIVLVCILGALGVGLEPTRAMAQEEGASLTCETADECRELGYRLRSEGRNEVALGVYERAYQLSHRPEFLAQRGLAEANLERWPEAEQHLRVALSERADLWIRERHDALQRALDAVREHLTRVEVSCNVEGASITVNGQMRGVYPEAARFWIPPGHHRIQVHAEGYEDIEDTVTARAGETMRLYLQLRRDQAGSMHMEAVLDEPHWANWLIGGGLVAVGVGLVVPAIATAALSGQCASPTIDAGVDNFTGCEEEYTFGPISGTLLGIGIAALAGGVIFLALQPLRMEVGVEASPHSAGLRLRGRF